MAQLKADAESLVREEKQKPFELSGWIDTAPFEDLVGITIESAGDGKAVLSFPFRLKLAQGGGLLHGGALTTLADTAVAMAIKTLLPEGTAFATTDLSMRFLSPVKQGIVKAVAEVKGPDDRVFNGHADLLDEKGERVAVFSSTFKVARGQGFGC